MSGEGEDAPTSPPKLRTAACTESHARAEAAAAMVSQVMHGGVTIEIAGACDSTNTKEEPPIDAQDDAQDVDAPVVEQPPGILVPPFPSDDLIARLAKEVASQVTEALQAKLEEQHVVVMERLRRLAPRLSADSSNAKRREPNGLSPSSSSPVSAFRLGRQHGSLLGMPAPPSLMLPARSKKGSITSEEDEEDDGRTSWGARSSGGSDEGSDRRSPSVRSRRDALKTKEQAPIPATLPGFKQRRESNANIDVQTLKYQLSGALLREADISSVHVPDRNSSKEGGGSPRGSVRVPSMGGPGRRLSATGLSFSSIFGFPPSETVLNGKVVPTPDMLVGPRVSMCETPRTSIPQTSTPRISVSEISTPSMTSSPSMPSDEGSNSRRMAKVAATTADVSMSRLRKQRTTDLLGGIKENFSDRSDEDSDSDDDDSDTTSATMSSVGSTKKSVPLLFLLFGLHPWHHVGSTARWRRFSAVYQWLVLVLAIAATVGVAEQTGSTRSVSLTDTLCYGQGCLRLGLISDLPIALGAVLCLLALGVHRRRGDFEEVAHILTVFAERGDYVELWRSHTRHHMNVTLLLWFIIMALRMHNSHFVDATLKFGVTATTALQMVGFAFLTGLLLACSFCMLFVCTALSTMVDVFCLNILNKDSLSDSVREWNVLQAVLRNSSHTIQVCFFVLQSTALAILLLSVADAVVAGYYLDLAPALLVAAGVSRIIYSAASVTDKCSHVPSLVSSFCNTIDAERQYVTQHIIHSAAGFYVFEVLLTSSMVLKFTYFTIVAAFTLATKVLSDSNV